MVVDEDALQVLSKLQLSKDPCHYDFWGRGYADLGFEVFLIIPNHLISIFTGEKTKLVLDHSFFYIPRYDELLLLLYKHDKKKVNEWLDKMDLSYFSLLQFLVNHDLLNKDTEF